MVVDSCCLLHSPPHQGLDFSTHHTQLSMIAFVDAVYITLHHPLDSCISSFFAFLKHCPVVAVLSGLRAASVLIYNKLVIVTKEKD